MILETHMSCWLSRQWITTTAVARAAAPTSGVVGVVTTGDGTFAMKSNGLPERLPLSDHWRKSEQLDMEHETQEVR